LSASDSSNTDASAEYASVPTAAAILGIGERTLGRAIKSGEIESRRVGGRRLVPIAAIRHRKSITGAK
jgi:excisionase family DNA binding protein